MLFLKDLGESMFHAFLLASLTHRHSTLISASLISCHAPCVPVSFLLTGKAVPLYWAHPNSLWRHPNWITSAKILFQIRSPSHRFWGLVLQHIFLGDTVQLRDIDDASQGNVLVESGVTLIAWVSNLPTTKQIYILPTKNKNHGPIFSVKNSNAWLPYGHFLIFLFT